MNQGPIITTLDIETSPLEVFTWGLFNQNISLGSIAKDWSIMAVAWKYLGKKKVHYLDTSEQADPRDDSGLLLLLWHVLDESDIVIGHNVKRFDLKKINARFMELGLPPPSPYRVIDTLEMAKSSVSFTSLKLEWLTKKLTDLKKDKHASYPGMGLWLACLRGTKKAWAAMRKYNIRDVASNEELYLVLRPWAVNHPNVAAYYDDEQMRCPRCGGTHLDRTGTSRTNVGEYHQYRCLDCGGHSKSRYTLNSLNKRKHLLTTN